MDVCMSEPDVMVCLPVDIELEEIEALALPAGSPQAEPVVVKRARIKLARGKCVEPTCGAPLRDAGRAQGSKFCSKTCAATFHNRQKVQGRQVLNIAKRWRREGRKGDFTALTRMLDNLIAADKALGIDTYPEPPIEAFQVRRNIAIKSRR